MVSLTIPTAVQLRRRLDGVARLATDTCHGRSCRFDKRPSKPVDNKLHTSPIERGQEARVCLGARQLLRKAGLKETLVAQFPLPGSNSRVESVPLDRGKFPVLVPQDVCAEIQFDASGLGLDVLDRRAAGADGRILASEGQVRKKHNAD